MNARAVFTLFHCAAIMARDFKVNALALVIPTGIMDNFAFMDDISTHIPVAKLRSTELLRQSAHRF